MTQQERNGLNEAAEISAHAAGAVRGTGASIPPMVVLLVSLCLFRIVWIQWVLPFFSSIDGIFLLYPVSWGLGALMMVGYAWKANWLET